MTTDTIESTVTLNPQQQVYVIDDGYGYSCRGFEHVRKHANHIADQLGMPELQVTDEMFGTMAAYDIHNKAIEAWATKRPNNTYFGPGVPQKLQRVINDLRGTGRRVRIVSGDPDTGRAWMELNDQVGSIGRSSGRLRSPLLLEDGGIYGGALSCDKLLLVRDMETGEILWQAKTWTPPDLVLVPVDDDALAEGFKWGVARPGEPNHANFKSKGKAAACLAFLQGEAIEPHVFNS